MTKTNRETTAKEAAPPPPNEVDIEREDWIQETPRECEYNLIMFSQDGAGIQEIYMTRDEFIALKARLAELRGYSSNVQ